MLSAFFAVSRAAGLSDRMVEYVNFGSVQKAVDCPRHGLQGTLDGTFPFPSLAGAVLQVIQTKGGDAL